jgi:CRP-like cAMP-binding protein
MAVSSTAQTPTASQPLRDDIQSLWRAFEPLSFELRSRALRLGEIRAPHAGDPFTPEGEIGVVLSGCLLLDVDQSRASAGVAAAGDLVDLGGGASGRWLMAGTLYRAPLDGFLQEAGDEGLRFLLSAGVKRTRILERRLACAMAHPAVSRVASLLLEMDAACDRADVPLCQAAVGEMLSLRRTSVNGACQTLRAAGAIRTVRGRTVVLDREVLGAHACCKHSILEVRAKTACSIPSRAA